MSDVIAEFIAGCLDEYDRLIAAEPDPSVRRILERVRPTIEARARERIQQVIRRIDDGQHEETLH
jgi:hypothetical protein